MWYGILFTLIVSSIIASIIAYFWVNGITRMMDEHPDYKGEDLFDEEPEK